MRAEREHEDGAEGEDRRGVLIGDSTYDLDTKVSETNPIRHTWSHEFRAVWCVDQQFR